MKCPSKRCEARFLPVIAALAIGLTSADYGHAQVAAPNAAAQRTGPFSTLVLSSAFLVDGTGAGVSSPVDIFISRNRIARILPSAPGTRYPRDAVVLDLRGKYILPGFVDSHAHIGLANAPADYICLLLLAHGITSVREVSPAHLLQGMQDLKRASKADLLPCPRLFLYPSTRVSDASDVVDRDVDGIKTYAMEPREELETLFSLAKARGLHVAAHDGGSLDALELASMGITSLEHFFGLPESIGAFAPLYLQDLEPGVRRVDGFRRIGGLWQQAVASAHADQAGVVRSLVNLGLTLVPTFAVYEAFRGVRAARETAWSDNYVHPSLRSFFDSGKDGDFSFWGQWTADDETAWAESFRIWEALVLHYVDAGGRVAVGADSGFMYDVWGFGFIREMELLREAGLSALQVVHAATADGAHLLGMGDELGTVEPGKLADMVVCNENPLLDFGVLYATGQRYETERSRTKNCAIECVIKDGIIYDAATLRREVRQMVAAAK